MDSVIQSKNFSNDAVSVFFSRKTFGVNCLRILVSTLSPIDMATKVALFEKFSFHLAALWVTSSVGLPSVNRKMSGRQSPFSS